MEYALMDFPFSEEDLQKIQERRFPTDWFYVDVDFVKRADGVRTIFDNDKTFVYLYTESEQYLVMTWEFFVRDSLACRKVRSSIGLTA